MYKWLLRIQEGRRWTGCAGAGARLAVASLALLALAVLSSCGDAKNSRNQYEWRQRLTVEVQTPAGIKTGSSVVRVRAKRVKEPNANGDLIETSVFGEATAVAVNREHTLFVLLSGENYPTQELLAWNVFSDLVSKKEMANIGEDGPKHLHCKPPGVGVVARAMEAVEKHPAVADVVACAMGEEKLRFAQAQGC